MIWLKEELFLDTNNGQVAQSVEQSPEKACVGGSIPSLATIFFIRMVDCVGIEPTT